MAVKREGLIFDEETNTARLLCVEPGCDIDLSISLLSRANENGEWWHIEELELHHKEGRVGDLKFDMRNLVCYCHKHHMKEERRREREGKR